MGFFCSFEENIAIVEEVTSGKILDEVGILYAAELGEEISDIRLSRILRADEDSASLQLGLLGSQSLRRHEVGDLGHALAETDGLIFKDKPLNCWRWRSDNSIAFIEGAVLWVHG